jgi:hypothetical protein
MPCNEICKTDFYYGDLTWIVSQTAGGKQES